MRAALLSSALLLAIGLAATAQPAQAQSTPQLSCELSFTMSGWSIFYKTSSGTGTVTCSNGQRMNVRLEARGGGLSFGRSRIEDGQGRFTNVYSIRDILGGYATAEAHAGAGASAKAQVVTKGPISLALSGTGHGVDLGVAFGSFVISER